MTIALTLAALSVLCLYGKLTNQTATLLLCIPGPPSLITAWNEKLMEDLICVLPIFAFCTKTLFTIQDDWKFFTWHWFCSFSLGSRILIFYYLSSHTDRSYSIIHRWTFGTSPEAKYNNLPLFGKRSFSFGLWRKIYFRVLFFEIILMQEAISDAKYA